jgi:hypothetical protein
MGEAIATGAADSIEAAMHNTISLLNIMNPLFSITHPRMTEIIIAPVI